MCILVLVAMRSGEKVLAAWLLRSLVRISLLEGMFVPCFYVSLSQALRRADHLSKESAMCVSEINVLWRGLNLTVTGVKMEDRLSKVLVY